MPVSGKAFRLLVVLSVVFAVSILTRPAEASIVKPFALNYDKVVYGDFLYAGNGVLRCPTAGDHAPATTGNSPESCADAAKRTTSKVGDDFFLRWSDVDSDAGTFDSAKASVTIPPGAKIAFARLNWAGNTGGYTTAPGVVSKTKMCQSRNNDTPAIPPPGSPEHQSVRLGIGTAKAVDVPPASYSEDALDTVTGGQYYSAYADVTSQFAAAPTGAELGLTVGNVWAPQGFGCVGGWSIVLVYAYPERNPGYAPEKRRVFVYDGHVRQRSADPATDTTITGFRAAAADAHVGLTAYDGDWGVPGDRFLINDTPAAEPATGSTSDFFISDADGAENPAAKNNFSVDAKSFNTDSVPAGATSAKLGFAAGADDFLAQNLAFSAPVPELRISQRAEPSVVHAGDTVTFTVAVENPGPGDASDVKVADDAFPACAKTLGALATGKKTSYTCIATASADDFTNTAKVTGTSTDGEPVDGAATASVDVVHPAIGVTGTADKPAYRAGDPVTFGIAVTNTGDVPLTSVTVTDPKSAPCARTLPGTLNPAGSSTFTCTAKAPIPDGVNTVGVTGTDSLGKQVTASTDAPVRTIAPAIDVTKTPSAPTVHGGEPVTWTVAVRNTGDSPLTAVRLTDDTTAACSRTFESLAAGETQTYTCAANPPKTVTTSLTATGTDLSGQPVSHTATATVTVINPALTVQQSAAPAVAREGDLVTFTVTVANTGDVPMTAVQVADDRVPACAKQFGTLEPQAHQTYTCTTPAPADDLAATAVATGTDPLGRTLKVTGDAAVDVIHPAVEISQVATPTQVREGDTVTLTVTATNTGDVPLTAVAVTDDLVPGCAKPLGTLSPGTAQTYTCTTVAGTGGLTTTANISGTDPLGRPVADAATATFTVQHPAVTLAVDAQGGPFHQGDPVTFQVTAKNTGDVPLAGMHMADASVPDCARALDLLAPGTTWTYSCTGPAPADDFTNAATITATPPVGPVVSASAAAAVDVIHPAIAITQTAAPAVVRAGDTVTFTLTVTNSGDTALRDVLVEDPHAPDCEKRLGTLEPQAKQTYTCTQIAGEADFTAAARVNGTDPAARPVIASAEAAVDVVHPAIALTMSAAPAQVREGDTVTFTLVIRNTGDVPLHDVSLVDDRAPSCAQPIGSLLPGAEMRHECKVTAGSDSFTAKATTSGNDPTGRPVTATADATVTVVRPGLAITNIVKGGPFHPGDTVGFTIGLTNTGDTPLTAVTVTDDLAPVCARKFEILAPGQKQTFDCTAPAPADDVTTTVKATGTAPTGPPAGATADAKVDVIHPAVKITEDPTPKQVRAGDDVTFAVVVTNTGDVSLTGVSVVGGEPRCAKKFDRIDVGAVQTYQCVRTAPADDFTDVATLTGADPTGRPVVATAAAPVDVIHPELAVMMDATPYEVREGDTVTFSVLVKNTGDVTLTNLSVVDDRMSSCAHKQPSLPVDAEATYTCTATAGKQGFTSSAEATALDPVKRPVTASGDTAFVVQHPALSVTKTVQGGPFKPGDPVSFEVVVTNTGDVELDAVAVTDETAPGCARTVGTLVATGVLRYPCTMVAPGKSIVSTAKATGTPPVGDLVTAEGSADVRVGTEFAGRGFRYE